MRLAGSGVSMRDSRSFAAGLALGMGLVMPEWMRGYLRSTVAEESGDVCSQPSIAAQNRLCNMSTSGLNSWSSKQPVVVHGWAADSSAAVHRIHVQYIA
jgi:hypothetical protein